MFAFFIFAQTSYSSVKIATSSNFLRRWPKTKKLLLHLSSLSFCFEDKLPAVDIHNSSLAKTVLSPFYEVAKTLINFRMKGKVNLLLVSNFVRRSQTTIIFLLDGCKSVMQRWVCLDKNKLAGHKILHHLDSYLVSCIAHNWNPSESRMELMKTAKSYITTNHGWAESNMRLGNDYLCHTDSLLLTSSNTRTPRPSPSLHKQRKKRRWVDSYFSAWHGLVLKRQVPFSFQTLWQIFILTQIICFKWF